MPLNLIYYSSCDLRFFDEKPLLPHMRILTLSGFHPENFRNINGRYSGLSCYGELKLAFCITQNIPYLDNHRVGAWCQTHNTRDTGPDQIKFNEGVDLPVPYSSLYDYSGVCFVLCSTFTDEDGMHDQYLAGCHLPLYNSKKVFRNAVYELELHPFKGQQAPRSLDEALGCIFDHNMEAKPHGLKELNDMLKVNRKHLRGELCEWPLDQKTQSIVATKLDSLKRDSRRIFIGVKFEFTASFPSLCIPVVFERSIKPVNMLAQPVHLVDVAKECKPNKLSLDKLTATIQRGYCEDISAEDADLIWQFRFFLANKFPETSIGRFLQSVKWDSDERTSQTIELLEAWPSIPPENVLELLTRTYTHPVCRKFAVSRLQGASDKELDLYLYQLVQALRYESFKEILEVKPMSKRPEKTAPNHPDRAPSQQDAATPVTPSSDDIAAAASEDAASLSARGGPKPKAKRSIGVKLDEIEWKIDLATFLIHRGQCNFQLANYLYWFLQLETHQDTPSTAEVQQVFNHILRRFLSSLEQGSIEQKNWSKDLTNQVRFVRDLHELLKNVQESSSKRLAKIDILRDRLRTGSLINRGFERKLPFPMNPNFIIDHIDADTATLFKSTTQPAAITLVSPEGHNYRFIFKNGDDLRQDQLVLQMIRLMDVVLKKEGFDMQLTPYNVLPVNCRYGFIQFVEGVSLSDTKKEGSILKFLQLRAPNPSDPLEIKKSVLDTYIRSCAGYCVITYLLGVGDRHMENIMLTPEGQLFHIDFGFILGNDPKPMAPEVRLTKAMIDAMGGTKTVMFIQFCNFCVTAFVILRRHANLFLTLLSLVHDSSIQDVDSDPAKACEFVRERFCLDQTDECAAHRFVSRLTSSVEAFMPEIMELIHTVMQYLRD